MPVRTDIRWGRCLLFSHCFSVINHPTEKQICSFFCLIPCYSTFWHNDVWTSWDSHRKLNKMGVDVMGLGWCFVWQGYNSRKEFIAAQGPLPTTVNEFWRMIWEKNVQTLVMLTRCNEQGRVSANANITTSSNMHMNAHGCNQFVFPFQVKCEQYWSSDTRHFDNITVTTTSEIPLEDWTIRDFDVKNVSGEMLCYFRKERKKINWTCIKSLRVVLQVKTAETRAVRHFHFTAWPDHGVPETTELLISFRHLVREHMDQYSRHSPTVVHCRFDSLSLTHTHTNNSVIVTETNPPVIPCPSCPCVYIQCWGRPHRYLHIHRSSDLPDRKGKHCGCVWHRPWSTYAPAPNGANRGKVQSTFTAVFNPSLYVLFELISKRFAFGVVAGSVCVLKPVRHGHHQGKNWNQCGSNLPKHRCALYLWECRTQKRFPQKRVPGCIGQRYCPGLLLLLSLLLARNCAGICKGNTLKRLCCNCFHSFFILTCEGPCSFLDLNLFIWYLFVKNVECLTKAKTVHNGHNHWPKMFLIILKILSYNYKCFCAVVVFSLLTTVYDLLMITSLAQVICWMLYITNILNKGKSCN